MQIVRIGIIIAGLIGLLWISLIVAACLFLMSMARPADTARREHSEH